MGQMRNREQSPLTLAIWALPLPARSHFDSPGSTRQRTRLQNPFQARGVGYVCVCVGGRCGSRSSRLDLQGCRLPCTRPKSYRSLRPLRAVTGSEVPRGHHDAHVVAYNPCLSGEYSAVPHGVIRADLPSAWPRPSADCRVPHGEAERSPPSLSCRGVDYDKHAGESRVLVPAVHAASK